MGSNAWGASFDITWTVGGKEKGDLSGEATNCEGESYDGRIETVVVRT